jgi:hypothetical protein
MDAPEQRAADRVRAVQALGFDPAISHRDCVHRDEYRALMENYNRALAANRALAGECQRLNGEINTLLANVPAGRTS